MYTQESRFEWDPPLPRRLHGDLRRYVHGTHEHAPHACMHVCIQLTHACASPQVLSMGSPELCVPSHGFAVTTQTASYAKACRLPWAALLRALRVVAWWRPEPHTPHTRTPD